MSELMKFPLKQTEHALTTAYFDRFRQVFLSCK